MADQFFTDYNQVSISYSQECIEDFYRNMFDLYGLALVREPGVTPRFNEIYEFGRPVLCLYKFMLSLSDLLQK